MSESTDQDRRSDHSELRERVELLLKVNRRLSILADAASVKLVEAVRNKPAAEAQASLNTLMRHQLRQLQAFQNEFTELGASSDNLITDEELKSLLAIFDDKPSD